MAKCSRCGASFHYEKRDGICPKCCFYNRPEGTASVDTSWMSKYGVEETNFQLPKFQSEHDAWEAEEEKRRLGGDLLTYMKKKKGEECDTEGSHVHTGRPTVESKKKTTGKSKKVDNKMTPKVTIISIVAFVYILIACVTVLIETLGF